MISKIRQNGGQEVKFHEVISYQIIPTSKLEGGNFDELKKLYYLGEVYKSSLIDSAIEKGEFQISDL